MKKCLIVLGMHRSGTSAIMGALNLLDLKLGSNFLNPSKDNPKGFFENFSITQLNEDILKSLGSSWDDTFSLPGNWWEKEELKTFKEEAIAILNRELIREDIFGIKDPRLCILLPLWEDILKQLSIKPYYIIIVRNPLEVAESLKRRNSFSYEKSLLLWQNYMLNAEFYSRHSSRIIVLFDEFLRDPKKTIHAICDAFDIKLHKNYQEVADNISQFLEPNLKHHSFNLDDASKVLLDFVYDYYCFLLNQSFKRSFNNEDILRVDNIMKKYSSLQNLFYNEDIKKEFREKTALITHKNAQVEDLNAQVEDINAQVEDLNAKLKDFEIQIGNLEKTLKYKNTHIHNLETSLNSKNTNIKELEVILDDKNSYIDNLRDIIKDRDVQISIFKSELNNIYNSKGWKLLLKYYQLRDRFLPAKSGREESPSPMLVVEGEKLEYGANISRINPKNDTVELGPLSSNFDKYDIMFFSIINWNYRYQRPQHIASRFAQNGHRVFYVSVDLKKQVTYQAKLLGENIFEITLPFGNDSVIYNTDLQTGIEMPMNGIKEMIESFKIKEAISFVEYPLWFPVVKQLKNKYGFKVIYDCLDEFSGFANANTLYIKEYDPEMIEISDLCVCTSKRIFESVKTGAKNIKLIPNATEFEHFNKLPENELLKDITKPIIGYYGAIAEWFDIDTIEYLAESKPDWNIILIGYLSIDVGRLKEYPNIHLLGEKSYEDLPKYLYWFDVCMIPFKLCDLILSTNPVKFYEYISSGKPVVSSNLPELEPYKELVYLADSKEDFLRKIELALAEDNEQLIKSRIGTAKENDWSHRVHEIEQTVKSCFPKVSIIIITYNNKDYTRLCINSILGKTAYPNYEIIVVDNASSDGTKDYLMELEARKNNVKVIINDANLGFAKANNIGVTNSDGEYIILLNNDTVVTRGWIYGLIKYFKDPSVGMVGPVTNSSGNESRINVDYSDICQLDSFAEKYTALHHGKSFEIKVLAMFCVALKREIVEKIGLLDEQFNIGMFEDDDYSIRVKRAGYGLLCVEDVFIHHFGSVSFNKLDELKLTTIFQENKDRFEKKWGITWKGHKYRNDISGTPPTITYDQGKYES